MRADEMGIRCPRCGAATKVLETRDIPGGLRRRRQCCSANCEHRLTTLEMEAPPYEHYDASDIALVPRETLQRVVQQLQTALKPSKP